METSESYLGNGLLPTVRATDYKNGGWYNTETRMDSLPGVMTRITASSSQAASPVNHSLALANERAQTITAFSGRKCCGLLKSSGPLGYVGRMLLESSRWHSTKVLLKWEAKPIFSEIESTSTPSEDEESCTESFANLSRSATPSRHLLFQLAPSTLPTEGIESGLLPTAKGGERGPDKAKINRSKTGISLETKIAMLPTPPTRDYKGANGPAHIDKNKGRAHMDQLPNAITHGTNPGLKLQPNFVEWMMGYPQGYTDLNCPSPNTESNG